MFFIISQIGFRFQVSGAGVNVAEIWKRPAGNCREPTAKYKTLFYLASFLHPNIAVIKLKMKLVKNSFGELSGLALILHKYQLNCPLKKGVEKQIIKFR